MWTRNPFYGGCSYYDVETNTTVIGHYNPDQLEHECEGWVIVEYPELGVFLTADDAINAVEEYIL